MQSEIKISEVKTMSEFTIQNGTVGVPIYFITDIMPEANSSYLKVYLYTLALASQGRSASAREVGAALNFIESDVINAYAYWRDKGVIDMRGDMIIFKALPPTGDASASEPVQKEKFSFMDSLDANPSAELNSRAPEELGSPQKYAPGEVSARLHANKSLSEMMTVAQSMLGKTLNTADTNTLYWFHDELGFSPEVILMLVEYCVGTGKTNMSFIERKALEWRDKNINTVEAADEYIKNKTVAKEYSQSLKKIMGIDNRKLVPTEEEYFNKWRTVNSMGEDMVALAYEYCIIQINKLSFAYMDKIIERWDSQGIYTITAAEEDNRAYRESGRHKNANETGGFDLYGGSPNQSEIDRKMIEKYNS